MRYNALNRNRDFQIIYKRGKSQVAPDVVLYVRKKKYGPTRVGITASKKIGNAVQRNRARRVIRHALYVVLPPEIGPYDLVFVARGRTLQRKSTQLEGSIRRLLEAAGLGAVL